jgi:hypothetical protein
VLEDLAEDARGQVERRRGGVIDVPGEAVDASSSSTRSSSSPASSPSARPPGGVLTVSVRCPCGSRESLERRSRTDEVLVGAFAALGWRRPVSGGWRCPDCAAKGGAHG